MVKNEDEIRMLNYYYRTYEAITEAITKTKQRLATLPGIDINPDFDSCLKGEKNAEGMETVKGRLSRALGKELVNWPIYEWLKKVPGIGPALAAGIILKYYYKNTPICQDCGGEFIDFVCQGCGKEAKGDGTLKYRLDFRDFPTISKWWAFMGRHTVDGVMPKRKKGVTSNWSTQGRTIGFHIGDQFNRQDDEHPYKKFMIDRKRKHAKNHPDWSKGHVHNAARNETVKLFLSHFWVIARTIEGLPVSEPYAWTIMGHTTIIEPFFWEQIASDNSNEAHNSIANEPSREIYKGIVNENRC